MTVAQEALWAASWGLFTVVIFTWLNLCPIIISRTFLSSYNIKWTILVMEHSYRLMEIRLKKVCAHNRLHNLLNRSIYYHCKCSAIFKSCLQARIWKSWCCLKMPSTCAHTLDENQYFFYYKSKAVSLHPAVVLASNLLQL